MAKYKVLVTGATGLVGLQAVKALLEAGHHTVAMVRPSSDQGELKRLNVPVVEGTLSEAPENIKVLAQLFSGVDVVVHAAGSVDPLGKKEDIRKVNVAGTRAVLEAAKLASVKQFIQISSLSVITGQGDMYNVNEEAPLKYCGEAYSDSKVDAEKLVMAETQDAAIKVTALRPGFIYGPGERAWMPRLITSLAGKQAMLVDGGKRQTNVIYVGNLSKAIVAAIMNARAFGQVYNLTDGEVVSKKMLFDTICDGLGIERITRKVPRAVAYLACELVSMVAPNLKPETQRKLGRFSRAAFRLAAVNQGFDVSKAERDLDYVERVSFACGMAETLKTFKTGMENPPGKRENGHKVVARV